jgi:uncharacterized protein YhfF
MTIEPASADALWAAYRATLMLAAGETLPEPEVWGFGDNPALADELGQLVAAGIKTATAGLFWEYEDTSLPLPQMGGYSIILDGQDKALCIIQTTEVHILPYLQVPAKFACDEGEGDRSLAYWREAHWVYFGRRCAVIGRTPSLEMPVVCERFRLVYPVIAAYA